MFHVKHFPCYCLLGSCSERRRSGKSSPQIAFAGAIITLSWQESASGVKIRMFERSEFGFLLLLLADFCKLRVIGSETCNLRGTFSRASLRTMPRLNCYIAASRLEISFAKDKAAISRCFSLVTPKCRFLLFDA